MIDRLYVSCQCKGRPPFHWILISEKTCIMVIVVQLLPSGHG